MLSFIKKGPGIHCNKIMFCHETGGPKTGRAYKQEGLQPGLYGMARA